MPESKSNDEEQKQANTGQNPNGYSPSADALEDTTVQVKTEHVLLFLGGLVAAIGLGGLFWSAADYYFKSRRYNQIADHVVEGIGALSEVAEKLEAHS